MAKNLTDELSSWVLRINALCAEKDAEIERLCATLGEIEKIANIAPADDAQGSLAVRMNKVWLLARGHQQKEAE